MKIPKLGFGYPIEKHPLKRAQCLWCVSHRTVDGIEQIGKDRMCKGPGVERDAVIAEYILVLLSIFITLLLTSPFLFSSLSPAKIHWVYLIPKSLQLLEKIKLAEHEAERRRHEVNCALISVSLEMQTSDTGRQGKNRETIFSLFFFFLFFLFETTFS